MPSVSRPKRLPVTVDRALEVVGISSLKPSPDGAVLTFAQSSLRPSEKTRASSLWAVPAQGGKLRRLTQGPEDDQPCWSPDGATLAFTRKLDPDKPPQVMLLPADGGEAVQLGDMAVAPTALSYAPNGKRLGFLAPTPDDKRDRERKKAGDDARVFVKDDKPQRLWALAVTTGKPRAISPETLNLWEYGWLPDSGAAAVIYGDEPGADAQFFKAQLGLLSPQGEVRPIGDPLGFVHHLKVSPDGRHAAVLATQSGAPFGGLAWLVDLASGRTSCLTPDLCGSVETFDWLPDGTGLLLQVGQGYQSVLYLAPVATPGELAVVCEDRPGCVEGLAIAPDSRRAYLLCQGPGQPPELYGCDLHEGRAVRLTHVNAAAEKLALGRSEVIRWQSSDGLEIEGQVTYPVGYRAGRAYPTILYIHGGPPGRFRSDLGLLPLQLLAAAGYVVLAPNPRGSSGYGEDFARASFGDWGGGDYRDLMAGVDHLIAEGIADPKRLGVWGASYGGYLTAWVVSQTNRFRAAICQCGLTNLFSFNGQTDIPSFLQYYFGANPYDDPERFRARSALTFIRQAQTPTLFLHGEQDVRVPIAQSYEMYWGLRHVGVDTEFVIYPREGHGIAETPHQRDLYRRALEWFKQRLK